MQRVTGGKTDSSWIERARAWVRSHQKVVIVGAGIAVIAIGMVAALALRDTDATDDEAAADKEAVDFTSGLGLGESDDRVGNEPRAGSPSTGPTSTSPATGAGSGASASGSPSGSGGAPAQRSAVSTGPVRLEVSTDAGWYLQGSAKTAVSLVACNDADHAISQTTPTGQLYEISVVDAAGEVVADDRDSVFTEGATQSEWAAGECKSSSESWVHTKGAMHSAREDRGKPLARVGDYRVSVSWIGDSVGPVESPVFSLRNTPPDVAPFARFEVTAGASGSGDSVDIDLAACNRAEFARVSHFNGAADFAVSVIDSSGDVVDSFNTVSDEAVVHRYPRIEPGGCRRHGLAWNSGGIEAGDYRVRVTYLGAENGEQLGAVVSDPFSLP